MVDERVRVRFAPSPTGYLHIGGARTALFNWLFARHHGGAFILRIEDTDRERSTEASARAITDTLRWLGLDWDEGPEKGGPVGPYFQSERLDLYRREAQRLLEADRAYPCYCTVEELEERRQEARNRGLPPRYDGRCRHLTEAERRRLESDGRRPALRIKAPETGQTVVQDLIRGTVVFENEKTLDDFVIMKSDGWPTYNFACAVDDAHMRISHVIRAEEHLSNTPKQMILCEALGYAVPRFAHVPMILAPDRSKLSKRHGAVAVEEFREAGYLPEAIINYLALLGWSPGDDREIMPVHEVISLFSLDRVNKTAAIYAVEKLKWVNGVYIRVADLDRLVDLLIPRLQRAGYLPAPVDAPTRERVRQILAVGRERARTLGEMPELFSYFFVEPAGYDEKGMRKYFNPETAEILSQAREVLAGVEPFVPETIETAYRALAERLGIPAAQVIHPTRLALTGRTVGPGLFDIILLLGRETVLARLSRAIDFIRANRG